MRVRVRNPKKYTYSPDPLPPINTPVKETTNIYNSVQHPFSMTDQKISDKSKPNISHEEHRISNATPEKKEKSSHLAHSLLNEQRKVKKQQETVTQQVFCIPKLKVLLFSSSFVVLFAFCFVLFVRNPSFFLLFFFLLLFFKNADSCLCYLPLGEKTMGAYCSVRLLSHKHARFETQTDVAVSVILKFFQRKREGEKKEKNKSPHKSVVHRPLPLIKVYRSKPVLLQNKPCCLCKKVPRNKFPKFS